MKEFCKCVLNMDVFYDIAFHVFAHRPHMDYEHFIFLVFVAMQYLEDFKLDDISFIDKSSIDSLLNVRRSDIIQLCLSRNVSTNLPERYIGLQIISAMVYEKHHRALNIVDLGCSLGLGLMALNTNFFLDRVKVDESLLQLMSKKPALQTLTGIDVQIPDLDWVLASYLPESLKKRESLRDTFSRLGANKKEVSFLIGNALSLKQPSSIPANSIDIVWISNVCYQVEGNIADVIDGIGHLLTFDGLWLYAYYRKDIHVEVGSSDNPYVITAFKKDKRWFERLKKGVDVFKESGMEVLEAPNELVEVIRPGKDFHRFIA